MSLFIVISGVVLAWQPVGEYARQTRRRLARLLTMYWWVAIPLIAVALVARRMPLSDLWKTPLWLTGLGIVSRGTFFPVVDSWWYISLAIQIVLVGPLVAAWGRRIGPSFLLVSGALLSLTFVIGGRMMGQSQLISGFVGCRFFELAAGFALVSWFRPTGTRRPAGAFVALFVCGVALLAADVALWGPRLTSIVLTLSLTLSSPDHAWSRRVCAVSGLTYALFLSHSPWARPILNLLRTLPSEAAIACGAAASLSAAIAVAWVFARSYEGAIRRWSHRSVAQRS